MPEVRISRPDFPAGYVENAQRLLPWSHVEQRLSDAINYWICSVRPDGRPHAIPRWAVWVAGKIYYDGSPQTRHARNLVHNPAVTLHLESGSDVLIVEGHARMLELVEAELGIALAQAYARKYAALGYAPQPDQWNAGGLYVLTPQRVIAWTNFTEDPTRFVLEQQA